MQMKMESQSQAQVKMQNKQALAFNHNDQQQQQQKPRYLKTVHDDDDGEDDDKITITDDDDTTHETESNSSGDSDHDNILDLSSLSSSERSSLFCAPVSECESCHGGKRSGHSGCAATGKRIKMVCRLPSSEGDEDNSSSAIEEFVYESCKRTPIEEEYLMVRFQGFCLFIAYFSLKSVRREKYVSASLFDMRARRRIRQEMVPLQSTSTGGVNGTTASTTSASSNGHGNNFGGDDGETLV